MPVRMTPLEPAAGDAIIVGDPRRAFALAQELTDQPRMSHQARGLWGYRGETSKGLGLTVQSTGAGGPAAVAVIGDLADQGAERVVRLGTCLAIAPGLEAGTVLLIGAVEAKDGTSRKLTGGADTLGPDPELNGLLSGIGDTVTVSSHDLVGRMDPAPPGFETGKAVARDLQTAAVFAMCRKLELPSAAILIVSEDCEGLRLEEEELSSLFRKTGLEVVDRLGER